MPAHRPYRVWRHTVGASAADALVYEESDEAFWVGVELTKSRAFLLIESASHATSETRYVPADRPDTPFRLVRPRTPGIEYDVTHRGDRFYLVTNKGARNFQLVSVPTSDPVDRVAGRHSAHRVHQAGRGRGLCRSPGGLRA